MPGAGVLYTEHADLHAAIPLTSLWSMQSRTPEPDRRSVARTATGNREYWLDLSDPLLNTILPDTPISIVVNGGDPWASGRSLASSAFLPRACVVGAFTTSRLLRVGERVRAVGAVVAPASAMEIFGVPASQLVDQILPLEDCWGNALADALVATVERLDVGRSIRVLGDALLARMRHETPTDPIAASTSQLIRVQSGRVPISEIAKRHGLSRRLFARRFTAAVGLPPKLFARITRFQSLVHELLSTDVCRWSSVSTSAGYYDQAHMINEFRDFTGLSPTRFFRPHSDGIESAKVLLRGRPCEWVQRPES